MTDILNPQYAKMVGGEVCIEMNISILKTTLGLFFNVQLFGYD